MSFIELVRGKVHPRYFSHLAEDCHVRVLDTPHVWGKPFSKAGIMPGALARTQDFETALVEIIQKSRYRCDLASLNSPDKAWAQVVLRAMDKALSDQPEGMPPIQFRFLFGQTPMIIVNGLMSPPLVDFQGALIRLARERTRSRQWKVMPDIWMAKFYRIREGLLSGVMAYMSSTLARWFSAEGDEASTKMTWNHSKIVAVDGAEALVGGHNLNMDLFTSYPPVHDVSVVMHGSAAHGAQLYLNKMWECGTDLVKREYLDPQTFQWKDGSASNAPVLTDPLTGEGAVYMQERHEGFAHLHGGGLPVPNAVQQARQKKNASARMAESSIDEIRREDLQTLKDLEEPVFQPKQVAAYEQLGEYRRATRVLSVGKYWSGSSMDSDYEKASEVMKEALIKGAKRTLYLSQMDLVSAWKKNWSSHVVCHWIMEALLANQNLVVKAVVSPLDAGAGAEGDQYSFGSGACRTFDLFRYYMTHDVRTDAELDDAELREAALDRLHLAPLYFTDVPDRLTVEGKTYKWPDLTPEGYTATLKQPSLQDSPPKGGVIGDAVKAVKMASATGKDKVQSAPGNHAKIMIVDEQAYVVGSDNLYPGFLSEFNYLVEGEAAVGELLKSYWAPLWMYSSKHCVNPRCLGGCKAAPSAPKLHYPLPLGLGLLGASRFGVPMPPSMPFGLKSGASLHPLNFARVKRIPVEQPTPLEDILRQDEALALKGVEERRRRKEASPKLPDVSKPQEKSQEKSKEEAPWVDPFENGDDLSGSHNYTSFQMFRLMEHYLGQLPNVVVLHGLGRDELQRIGPEAYRDAVPANPVNGTTLTLVQPYNVNGNHWGLLYIKVTPPTDAQQRKARVLYVDPLHPDEVPDLSGLRRAFPSLTAERSTVRYQNDVNGSGDENDFQHSCGAWVVYLSRHLATQQDLMPAPPVDPRDAAVRLRATHQSVIDTLNGLMVDVD
ncbi:hypothetical protein [Corallococcus sp. AB049A]|uniref:hypothetical protein n=1 Tax=Corallococcus sp. AB049A TaxID=2316721 RepID=UPI0018F6BED4|nr:hypothetical protein [Corallococcus sp. AB049A]